MFCQKCGTENTDTSKFCVKCANALNGKVKLPGERRAWPLLVFGMMLPWVLAIGLGAYVAYIEVVRTPDDLQNTRQVTAATQQWADALMILQSASSAETGGHLTEARTLWNVGEKLGNNAADAWLNLGNEAMAKSCREQAASHLRIGPMGESR
jgi:hypothetical protein